MKKIICLCLCAFFVFCFGGVAFAETNDITKEAKAVEDTVDNETKKILDSIGAHIYSSSWVEELSYKNIFSYCLDFIKSGGSRPFKALTSALAVLILCSLMQNLSPTPTALKSVSYASLASFSVIIAPALYSLTGTAVSLLKSVSVFIGALTPFVTALMAASGKPISAAGSSVSLSVALSALSVVTSFLALPLMNAYLSFGVCAGFTKNKGLAQLAKSIKKVVNWIFSLAVTIFLAVFSAKSSIAAAEDNLTTKTAKFVLGSTVPITGGVLSETLGSVVASLSLIKKSAVIYAAAVLFIMVLPVLIETLCWKFCFLVIKTACAFFVSDGFLDISEIFNDMLSMLFAVLLLVPALFVIMLGIAVSV